MILSCCLHSRGFQREFQASSKYLQAAVDNIEAVKQTVEQHMKKLVQMHMLAKNIAVKLYNKQAKEDALVLYGETLKYKKVFTGKMEGGEFVTIE